MAGSVGVDTSSRKSETKHTEGNYKREEHQLLGLTEAYSIIITRITYSLIDEH